MAEKAHLRGESAYSFLLDGYSFIRGERRLVLETRCSVIATSVLLGSLCSRIRSFSSCKARNMLAGSFVFAARSQTRGFGHPKTWGRELFAQLRCLADRPRSLGYLRYLAGS